MSELPAHRPYFDQTHIQNKKHLNFEMPNPQEMHHLIEFCKVMASAPFYQKLGPGGVMAIYLTAKEYNIPFMSCLNGGLYTFDGKVSFSAIMINAMIINAGHTADLIHIDDYKCVIRFTRGDRKSDKNYTPLEYEYNTDMAHKAGYLSKTNWKTSPRDMLYSRCLTGGGRKHIPEVFVGVLSPGELVGDDRDQFVAPLVPADVSAQTHCAMQQPTKALEHQPMIGYDDFVIKHNLTKDEDGKISEKMQYILETCKKAKMQEVQVINAAIKNEKLFEDKFSAWHKKTYPQIEKSDEDTKD